MPRRTLVPAMQDAMEAVRSQAEAVARSQAGSIVASTVPLLNDVASLLVRAHDEGQRSITSGPTVPDPSLLTPRFSDPLVCTTGGTEAQAVAAAHQSFREKRTRGSDDSWEDGTPHLTVKSVDGTSHQYPFGSQMQRQQVAVLTSGGVLTSDTLTYGLTLNQHNELVPHGGRVEEKRQQLEASAEAERLQAFEKLLGTELTEAAVNRQVGAERVVAGLTAQSPRVEIGVASGDPYLGEVDPHGSEVIQYSLPSA